MDPIIQPIDSDEDVATALRKRREDLGLSVQDVQRELGLTDNAAARLEAGGRRSWGRGILRMTLTLMWLLEFYGLQLVLIDKRTANLIAGAHIAERRRPHYEKRSRKNHPIRKKVLMRLVREPEEADPLP